MDKFILVPATTKDFPIIENLWRFYLYDLSRYCSRLEGWVSPTDLSFRLEDLKAYLSDVGSHVFLIQYSNHTIGFVYFKKLALMPEVDWFLSDFFIISSFQYSGIGTEVARNVFSQFKGEWCVGMVPENTRAVHFWRKLIKDFTRDNFSEEFKTTNPYPMIMFRFRSV